MQNKKGKNGTKIGKWVISTILLIAFHNMAQKDGKGMLDKFELMEACNA